MAGARELKGIPGPAAQIVAAMGARTRALKHAIDLCPTYMEMETAARALDEIKEVPDWLKVTFGKMRSALIDISYLKGG